VRIDAPLLVGLAAAIVVVLIARVLVTAWLQAFRAGASSRNTEPRPAKRLTHPPLPPVATVGVRMAFRPRDATVRSARTSTVVGVTVALATALAALTFAASLDRLITRPESYGWTWDSLLETYENGLAPATRRDLERDEHVEAFTIGARSPLIVDGDSVSGIGFDPVRGDLLPTITEGRFPARPDEIALGPATLRRLDRSIGDEVTITDASAGTHQLHVVGRTVIPSLNLDDVYGLADGAAMTLEGLQAISTGAEPAFALVDFAVDAGRDAIAAANDRYGESGTFLGVQQPGEIISFDGVRRTPLMLAGLLALLGLGVLVHGLLTTVRGGRHVFAVLKTIGFSRRQVRATIGWQVNAMVILSAVLAVPVGVAGGRLAWSLLAGRLGLTDEPVLPLLAVFLLLLATVVVANVVAIGPSHMAARTRPARLLRAE